MRCFLLLFLNQLSDDRKRNDAAAVVFKNWDNADARVSQGLNISAFRFCAKKSKTHCLRLDKYTRASYLPCFRG